MKLDEFTSFVDERGNMFACPLIESSSLTTVEAAKAYTDRWRWIVNVNSVAPEFRTLIEASILLHNVVAGQRVLLEHLIEVMEEHGADVLVDCLQSSAAALASAQRVANEGHEKVYRPSK